MTARHKISPAEGNPSERYERQSKDGSPGAQLPRGAYIRHPHNAIPAP